MKKPIIVIIISFLLFSCKEVGHGELRVIQIDVASDVSLPLSTIADEITAIELEVTDESLINPDRIRSIHLFDNHIILHVHNKILVFDLEGKFVRSIGSKGQGPGEFLILLKLAIDKKNKRLIAVDHSKIICYDLNGKFLFQSSAISDKGKHVYDINCINDEIFALVDQIGAKDAKGAFSQPQIYRLNDALKITDSITTRKTYFEKLEGYGHIGDDYILNSDSISYIYFPDQVLSSLNAVSEVNLRDTLYRFEYNNLVPELKIKFKDNWFLKDDNLEIGGIYRSARYVFAMYTYHGLFRFCYDLKTGKGYNMKNGFTDDIHKIEQNISIRPFATNTELFYFWYTHLNKDDVNSESNPTLYIGKLKK